MSIGNCTELFCAQRNSILITIVSVITIPMPWTLQVG
nr:MAG TPA: hypothetical protein [Caudoviricetes sp.]